MATANVNDNVNEKLIKGINWLLKHGTLRFDGFMDVDTILKHRNLKKFSREDVQNVVENPAGHRRYVLKSEGAKMYIATEKKANAMIKFFEELSRELSRYLRHGPLRPDGFAEVDIMLKYHDLKKYSREDVKNLVANQAEFKRFALRYAGKKMYIISVMREKEIDIKPHSPQIFNASSVPKVIYPTTFENWKTYTANGFCRKSKRAFMHFFLEDVKKTYFTYGMGEYDFNEYPSDIDVVIYINLKLALRDSLEFYRSEHNLILTRGNDEGILEPKYIEEVFDIRAGKRLSFP